MKYTQELKKLNKEVSKFYDRKLFWEFKIYPLEKKITLLEEKILQLPENKEFVDKCKLLDANQFCIDIENKDDFSRVSEDDGTLFITKGKIRACFISNQDVSAKEWQSSAEPILKEFGFSWKDFN